MPPKKKKKKSPQKLTYVERSQRVAKERRRRPVVRKALFITRCVALAAVFIAIVWGAWSGEYKTALDYAGGKALRVTSEFGLNLESIYVQGGDHITEQQILDVVHAQATLGGEEYPLFEFSIPQLKASLMQFGWVKSVDIERRIPNALYIRVTERTPAAIWQQGREFTLMDDSGALISKENIKDFRRLPIAVGEDAPQAIAELFAGLDTYPELREQVQSMVRMGGRRWNVTLKSGTTLKLPESELDKAFGTLRGMHRDKQILDRAVKVIDLRDTERVYVLPE